MNESNSASKNINAEGNTELGLRPRLIAAGWFVGAACIPILFFFGVIGRMLFFRAAFDAKDPLIATTFILLPISMAAFFGFSFGSRILNDGTCADAAVLAQLAVAENLREWLDDGIHADFDIGIHRNRFRLHQGDAPGHQIAPHLQFVAAQLAY